MISIHEAIELILDKIHPLPTEIVLLGDAVGRVLRMDVDARRDIPPQDNSAMDGYAFAYPEDAQEPLTLEVIDFIAAGHRPSQGLQPGEAAKIMTGAPVPDGADTVIPVEDTEAEGITVTFQRIPKKGANIRLAGEDVKEGEAVMSPGVKIRPTEAGMFAALGRSVVSVSQRPRVAILSTGDEIVEIDEAYAQGKIVNSNAYGLAAQVTQAGGVPVMLGIGRDSPEALYEILESARLCDMVLTTGGVSMGDRDFMLEVFEKWGVKREFWKVSMKPGKPVAFGMKGRKPVFGLPGNPVSAMVAFEQFVRPALRKMLGFERLFRPVFTATLAPDAGAVRAKVGRTEFVRCSVEYDGGQFKIVSVKKRGSGILSTLVEANGLMIIPAASEGVEPGGEVKVQLYDYELIEGADPGW